MTSAERHALTFIAFLLLLGVGVRVVRARGDEARPTAAERAALAAQIAAVDSVRTAEQKAKAERKGRSRSAAGKAKSPADRSRSRRQAAAPRDPADVSQLPPLRPVAASDRPGRGRRGSAADRGTRASDLASRVDLDLASEAELVGLPGIGPALARRIIADREASGPYGSLGALQRVRGIGPATAERLAPHVTFSHRPRHLRVEDPGLSHPLRGDGALGVRPPAP